MFDYRILDFGLAKLLNYMAPEYASSGKLADRSDVFSCGVVLLELVTGRRPVESSQDESLVEWAKPLIDGAIETEDCSELVDPRLRQLLLVFVTLLTKDPAWWRCEGRWTLTVTCQISSMVWKLVRALFLKQIQIFKD